MLKSKLLAAAALAVGLGVAGAAAAGPWEAFVIENYTGNQATAADYAANELSAVFIGDVPVVNFDSNVAASYTIGDWLATGGFSYAGPLAGDTLNNTLWLFYTDQTFSAAPVLTVTHDDGIEVRYQNLLGPAYSGFTSGGTSAITETGHCAGCNFPGRVGIIYNEAFGAPGVLQVNAVGAPEPAEWSLMILGFGALGMTLRSRRKAAVA